MGQKTIYTCDKPGCIVSEVDVPSDLRYCHVTQRILCSKHHDEVHELLDPYIEQAQNKIKRLADDYFGPSTELNVVSIVK